MELAILNTSGKETGRKVDLNDAIFGIEPNDHAIYLDSKQKGTGTARAGNIRNPLFRGGGRVFGPKPRYYGFKLNKKVKQLARKSALSYKASTNNIIVLEDFSFESPKTKEIIEMGNNLNTVNKKSVFVLPEQNNNIYLSSRNVQGVEVIIASELSTYKIMRASTLILVESAVDVLQATFEN